MEEKSMCPVEREFDLVLADIPELTDEVVDALYEAGCDDSTICMRSGRVHMTFDREAMSMRDAVLSAIRDIRKAGYGANILRVDTCNLVTQSEIARRIGRSRQLVNQYVTGARGPGNFPAPTCDLYDGHSLYRWCEVSYWLYQNGMVKEDVYTESRDMDLINMILSWQYQKKQSPDATEAIFKELADGLPA